MISKYPPHKGGTAGINYWFARTLGEMGHKIHIVTDLPESENYIKYLDKDLIEGYEPKNVKVHSHKPTLNLPVKSKISTLANTAMNVIDENDIDVIDTKYFIPYGVAGFLSKLVTGKPLVTRHGGSDITYLLKSPLYNKLLVNMLKNSDKLILDPTKMDDILRLGIRKAKIECKSDFGMNIGNVNTRKTKDVLKRFDIDQKSPIIGCFGKISACKGVPELLNALSKIKDDFTILLLPEDDKEHINRLVSKFGLSKKTKILNYQSPWIMPYLYNSLTALIATEVDFPVKMHTPLTAYESFYFGKCTVISKETYQKPQFRKMEDEKNVVVVEPKDTANYTKKLEWILKNPKHAKRIGENARKLQDPSIGIKNAERMAKIYREVANF